MKGKFITLEGVEGTGKSTQAQILCKFLQDSGKQVVLTREPGGTGLAEKIREILLSKSDEPVHPDTELLLMFAARAQHLRELILPALARGDWVVCDRFIDATYAYQGYGRGMAKQRIDRIADWLLQGVKIDCTLLFDMPMERAQQRVNIRGPKDRFELEQQSFFEKVRTGYLEIAHDNPDRIRLIQADQSVESVARDVVAAIRPLL